MFRLSVTGGGDDSGFLLELFRDSHANGLVSFLAGGGAGTTFSCTGGGGGGNLTGDILPERPWVAPAEFLEFRGGSFGSGPVVFAPSAECQRQRSIFYNYVQQDASCEKDYKDGGERSEETQVSATFTRPAVLFQMQQVHLPSSNATSSMSEVTDILWAVSRGDFADGASSPSFSVSCLGISGTSGGGESGLESWAVEEEDSRLLMSDRDRDCGRSECELGRGVISGASSKLSCSHIILSARRQVGTCLKRRLTPSLSELCELVGRPCFWSISAGVEGAGCGRLLNGDLKGSCSQCRDLLRPAGLENKDQKAGWFECRNICSNGRGVRGGCE